MMVTADSESMRPKLIAAMEVEKRGRATDRRNSSWGTFRVTRHNNEKVSPVRGVEACQGVR